MPEDLKILFADYDYCRHAGTRPGYAGTAIFWRRGMMSDVVSCNTFAISEMFYEDGRVTEINFSLPASSLIKEGDPQGGGFGEEA
jgi:exonuclease III